MLSTLVYIYIILNVRISTILQVDHLAKWVVCYQIARQTPHPDVWWLVNGLCPGSSSGLSTSLARSVAEIYDSSGYDSCQSFPWQIIIVLYPVRRVWPQLEPTFSILYSCIQRFTPNNRLTYSSPRIKHTSLEFKFLV